MENLFFFNSFLNSSFKRAGSYYPWGTKNKQLNIKIWQYLATAVSTILQYIYLKLKKIETDEW